MDKKLQKRLTLSLVMLFFTVFSTLAQVTTSSMSGVVKDGKGDASIGATVKAVHVPSGTVYSSQTNVDGRFFIANMRTGGPYTLEVSYIGYQPQKFTGINLLLGETYKITATLSSSDKLLNEVVVTAQGSKLNNNKTGASTNVSTEQLTVLPTISRSVTDFTRLTPQANGNGFAGRDGRYNNLQIDGANFNNGFGLSSNPLPGGSSQPISIDAIEEVQINIAPFDVRQSGFTGAGINAVTRSGTNQFKGSAYTFYRNENYNGNIVNGVKLPAFSKSKNLVYGARVGGPIIKNKLFFFANYENESSTYPGINWVATRPGVSGSNVSRTTAVDLDRVKKYLQDTYQYDPGAYENFANDFQDKSDKFLARLDWNINTKNKFTLRYTQVEGTSDQTTNATSSPNPRPSSSRIGSNSLAFENSQYQFKNVVKSVTAELNSVLSPALSNQFLATYSKIQDTRTTPGEDFPFVDIQNGGDSYMSFGTELFSKNNDVINNNYSFVNNLTLVKGNHTFTGGASFEIQNFGNSYQRYATSYYRYASVDDFINNAKPLQFGLTYPYEGQDPYSKINFGLAGAYFQDKININDKFDLTLGIRAELPLYLNELTANPSIDALYLSATDGTQTTYNSGKWPKSRLMVSPRVGFNYDVFGDRSLKVRGGTGVFAGRVPFVFLTNMPTGSGVIQNVLEGVPAAALDVIRFNKDPQYWLKNGPSNVFIKTPNAGAPGSFALVDRDFKMPMVWRSSLGADYAIPNTNLIASADLLYTKDINAVYQFNTNRRAATMRMNYSGDKRDFWNNTNVKYNNAISGDAVVLSNTDKGNSYTLTAGLSMPSNRGFFGSIYYTYSMAKDVSANPGSSAGSAWSNNYSINDPNELLLGYSQYSIPHRVIANASYKFEYLNHLGTTVSLFYEGANQNRFAYTYNGDLNRDGVSNDLLYIPQNSADLTFSPIMSGTNVLFTPEQQRAAFDKFVDNDKSLKNSRGGYVERNAGLLPWFNRFDFRLLQDVFTDFKGKKNSLQLSVDIKNMGNLLNNKWGVYQELNSGGSFNYALLKVASVSATGVPTFNMITIKDASGATVMPETAFRDNVRISSTWSMQIGLRYIFN